MKKMVLNQNMCVAIVFLLLIGHGTLWAQTWDYSKYKTVTTDNTGAVVVGLNPKAYTEQIATGEHAISVNEPVGYYNNCVGLQGETLRLALHNVIAQGALVKTYSEVWDMCKAGDQSPDNANSVWLIYTENSRAKTDQDNGSGGVVWNREHVWAKSHGDFGTDPGPGTDGHHLRAADDDENANRSYFNFGEVSGPRTQNGEFYEPPLSAKGDVARMIFYMAVRYEGDDGFPDLEVIEGSGGNKAPTHGDWQTLLRWHELDPVDPYEIRRNNTIYGFQHNRNPFIDHPELVHLIFGSDKQVAWNGGVQFANSPGIFLLGEVNTFPITLSGNVSEAVSYAVKADKLTEDVVISAPDHFELSLTGDAREFVKELRLMPLDGKIENTTVYVRFAPTISVDAVLNGEILHKSGEVTTKLFVRGTEGDPTLVSKPFYLEYFEEKCAPQWLKIDKSSNKSWNCTNAQDYLGVDGSVAMQINNYQADAASDDWLISPAMNIQDYSRIKLSYWLKTRYSGSELEILYATNYDGSDQVNSANWISLGKTEMPTNWTSYLVDVPQITGDRVHFAFRHTAASNGHLVQLDNVELLGVSNGKSFQEIYFDAITTQFADGASFVLTAHASSDLAVEYTVLSGPATVLDDVLTLTGEAGVVVLEARQTGSDTYSSAASVQRSFEVKRVAQTLTFDALENKKENAEPFTLTATSSSGLAVSFTVVSGPARIVGNKVTLNGTAGTVTIRAEQTGNATYLPAEAVEQTFEVEAVITSVERKHEKINLYYAATRGLLVFSEPIPDRTPIGIYTLTGRQVVRTLGNGSKTVSIGTLNTGTYLVKILDEQRPEGQLIVVGY